MCKVCSVPNANSREKNFFRNGNELQTKALSIMIFKTIGEMTHFATYVVQMTHMQ